MSKSINLCLKRPKKPTALWNRFGVGRSIVYKYSDALRKASLACEVAQKFDENKDRRARLDAILSILESPENRSLLRRVSGCNGAEKAREALKSKVAFKDGEANLFAAAVSIAQARQIKATQSASLPAAYAMKIAAILKLPVLRIGDEPSRHTGFYGGAVVANIRLGPGHFYTRRYLDTPSFQHLCSFHSLGEVLAAMKSTPLGDVLPSDVSSDAKNESLERAASADKVDLLSAHLCLLEQEQEQQQGDEKGLFQIAAEGEVLKLLKEINRCFEKELTAEAITGKSNEQVAIEAEKIWVGCMAGGYTVSAVSVVGVALFASPAFLATTGLATIPGVGPSMVITSFALIAVLAGLFAVVGSVGASNNPGRESQQWVGSESLLFDTSACKVEDGSGSVAEI